MKLAWRKLLAYLFLRKDLYYTYHVYSNGRERYDGLSTYNYYDRGFHSVDYSLTQREAYIKGKISLDGNIKN